MSIAYAGVFLVLQLYVSFVLSKFNYGIRIVGGKPVKIEEVPYQLGVYYESYDWAFFCGASIISANWAISAAHCFANIYKPKIVLASGSEYLLPSGTKHKVERIINHPKYMEHPENYDYDISLLKVIQPFKLGTKKVNSIKLAAAPPSVGAMGVISGWGVTIPRISQHLQKASVPIFSTNKCETIYSFLDLEITERMICAGYEKGKVDSCQGDSGGPLAINGELVGIVSFGYGCAQEGFPGVYTRVDAYRNWIKTVTGV